MTLFLFPNLLSDRTDPKKVFPEGLKEDVLKISLLLAESDRAARRFLSHFMPHEAALKVTVALFTKQTAKEDLDFLLEPAKKGESIGLISDAGLPVIADPGALLVARARALGIEIFAYPGPSSLFLALMLSGIPSQEFHFLGYLPREKEPLTKAISSMNRSLATCVCIEAPQRNQPLLEAFVANLDGDKTLSVAYDLMGTHEKVLTLKVSAWRKSPLPKLEKRPCVFMTASL